MPLGKPRGSVVLLHGLTDSPYSVRYLAQLWQQRGYVAVAPRLPGHGTAPGALTAVDWETWLACRNGQLAFCRHARYRRSPLPHLAVELLPDSRPWF